MHTNFGGDRPTAPNDSRKWIKYLRKHLR